LSQNAVSALLQDRRGFMWFGTKDGLNRCDGYQFVVFRHDPFDSTSTLPPASEWGWV
jgi:ligand-binding sensor domain-containing protein